MDCHWMESIQSRERASSRRRGDFSLDGDGNVSLRREGGDLGRGEEGRHRVQGRETAEVLAERMDPGDLVVEDLLLNSTDFGLISPGCVDGGEDATGEAAAGVDDLSPEGSGLPPAGVGGVVAEADDDADGAAVEGQRDVT